MNKLIIYNKRNILQQFIFAFAFSLLLFIFTVYFAPIRFYDKSFETFKDSKLNEAYYITNLEHNKLSREYFRELKRKGIVKNIFLQAIPNWKINEETGLYSVPQFFDIQDFNTFPIKINENIDISKLDELNKDNYYLILSPLSKAKVGDIINIFDSNNNKIVLHAIARQKLDQIHLYTYETSSNSTWPDILKIYNKQDYILVKDKFNLKNEWTISDNFILDLKENKTQTNNLFLEKLKKNDFKIESVEQISRNTSNNIEKSIYLNISFLIIGFLIFTLLFINLSFLNTFRFKKRYIIYRKLGSTKFEIVFYRILANIVSLAFGLLLSWLYVYILNMIKPEQIFMRENLLFDITLFLWTFYIFIFYVLLSSVIQIINVNNDIAQRGSL